MNKYLRHITNLCQRHNITLVTGKAYDDYVEANQHKFSNILSTDKYVPDTFSVMALRMVAIPVINTKETYFNALHEIGHLVCEGSDGEGQFNAAHRLKKVTKYILRTEQDASIFAIKANKYATIAYLDRLAAWNQFHYIEEYENDWQTKLNKRDSYMQFSPRRK